MYTGASRGALELLPTPCAQQSGNTPENHLRKKPGRKVVTDLAILVENGLLGTCGELLPTPTSRDHKGANQRGDDTCLTGALLPTPNANDFKGASPTVRDGDGGRRPATLDDATRARGAGGASGLADVDVLLPTPNASDGSGGGQHPDRREGHSHQLIDYVLLDGDRWGKYATAIRRWEALTRPAPSPTEPNTRGNPRLAPAFSEWMLGWPEGWVTQVPGISRNDQLRIIGNGVVPQQAEAALRYLLSVAEVAA